MSAKISTGTGTQASAEVERERLIVARMKKAGMDASMPVLGHVEREEAKQEYEDKLATNQD